MRWYQCNNILTVIVDPISLDSAQVVKFVYYVITYVRILRDHLRRGAVFPSNYANVISTI